MNAKPYERQVNYYETDQMGIAHHSNYLRYFEEARMDFMRQLQLSTQELENIGINIPNVDAYARYLRLLHFEDRFLVLVKPALYTGVRMKFEYEVRKGDELCSTGYTTHCFVDKEMKPIILKHNYPELHAKFTEIFNG